MKNLVLRDDVPERPLIFYLALEEFVARHLEEDVLFLWQVSPTVISGRNQVLAAEVNLNFCQEHGIKVFRRKSGGGTVYSDMGNIMVSYIVSSDEVPYTFDKYMSTVALYLRWLGIPAEVSGRNDITVGGRKVSGNAFYKIGGRSIIHGTMLFNSDFSMMTEALTPSFSKVSGKGVASVRQRVANISEFAQIGIEDFKKGLISFFCDGGSHGSDGEGSLILDDMAVAEVEKIMQTYLDEDFMTGHEPEHTIRTGGRIEGVGEIDVFCNIKNGKLKKISFKGDFFPLCEDVDATMTEALKGIAFSPEAIDGALPEGMTETLIRNLRKKDLINLIWKN